MNSSLLLANKVAVITGAGRGVGAAVATAYAAEGAKVVVSDLDVAAATRVAKGIPNAIAIGCDVRKPEEVEALVKQTIDKHGRLDIMVPNAGVAKVIPIVEMSYAEWREVMSVDLDGVFLCVRYAAPALIAGGGGVIVNMCSITAQAAVPLIASYAAAEAGVMSLTQTAALELRAHNIRVNAILPGFIETALVKENKKALEKLLNLPDFDAVIAQKQGRYGTAEEVAKLAVFLASDRARFSTGGAYVLDGGARASLL
ncbi:MAG TPA: SDR family oxidoreductase [Polyangia bacterium]|jgi:NAD(P)-dependent dehydrogenase (short-subunit alcohol dehydrogenase family)|nr:SDR family oxidoreductase [Polyangia bacterium]